MSVRICARQVLKKQIKEKKNKHVQCSPGLQLNLTCFATRILLSFTGGKMRNVAFEAPGFEREQRIGNVKEPC